MSSSSQAGRGKLLERLRAGSVHVVGASGAEGSSLLLHLAGELGVEGIVAHDFANDERSFARSFRKANPGWERREREALLSRLLRLPIELRLGARYLHGVGDADTILASQNWFNYASNLPALPDAIAGGSQLHGLVEVALDLFPGTRLGVTGSNGKSTTSALIVHLLGAGLSPERSVLQGGNDRSRQVSLKRIGACSRDDVLVWEVSNRHLRLSAPQVDIAVLTNITRNHIEDHGSWEAYVEAKLRLPRSLSAGGHAVLCSLDPVTRQALPQLRQEGRTIWQVVDSPENAAPGEGAAWLTPQGGIRIRTPGASSPLELGSSDALALSGEHNRLNLLSALCASLAAGAEPDALRSAISSFGGLPGRLETVAEADGVRWIYDIQATTAPAAQAGIQAIGESGTRIVLLVGGDDKGMDYGGMADAAATHCDRILVLPGSGSEAFLAQLGRRVSVDECVDLAGAIERAREVASPGCAVLLSPGCAFFHSRYIEGGPSFQRRVAEALASPTQAESTP